MKQFGKILKFEWNNYLHNKVFVGITVFLVAVIAVVLFFPRILGLFETDDADGWAEGERPVMWVDVNDENTEALIRSAFEAAFPEYDVRIYFHTDMTQLQGKITDGSVECAFVLHSLTSYTYYINNLSMYDMNPAVANEVLQEIYRAVAMVESGLSPEEAQQILETPVTYTTESLGVDQMQNFFYTYIMIFALYMVILLYGQMVATNVATEKSSRAMEVLITSADPIAMMFGKVLASCAAGLLQLIAVFGSAILCFRLNASYWGGNEIVESIFNMPPMLLAYMLIFFILGFLIYAFLFGAIGSTASKLEDINTSVMPVTLLFVFGFLVVMISMSSGDVDSLLMRVCSYIPFTSPMAMFTRIAMSTVPLYEIILSVAILLASVFGIGVISAKIYRVGVLLYGTPPKIGVILKAIRKN